MFFVALRDLLLLPAGYLFTACSFCSPPSRWRLEPHPPFLSPPRLHRLYNPPFPPPSSSRRRGGKETASSFFSLFFLFRWRGRPTNRVPTRDGESPPPFSSPCSNRLSFQRLNFFFFFPKASPSLFPLLSLLGIGASSMPFFPAKGRNGQYLSFLLSAALKRVLFSPSFFLNQRHSSFSFPLLFRNQSSP